MVNCRGLFSAAAVASDSFAACDFNASLNRCSSSVSSILPDPNAGLAKLPPLAGVVLPPNAGFPNAGRPNPPPFCRKMLVAEIFNRADVERRRLGARGAPNLWAQKAHIDDRGLSYATVSSISLW
jgi:hypothetical protein